MQPMSSEDIRETMSKMSGTDLNQYILGQLGKLERLLPDAQVQESLDKSKVSWIVFAIYNFYVTHKL